MQNFKKTGHSYPACSFLRKLQLLKISSIVLLLLPFLSYAQTKPLINSPLKGQVIDSLTKQGIPSVSVHITGTTHSVQTDGDGRFDFVTGQKFPYTLEIRHLSYQTKTIIANSSPLVIKLKENTGQLNDVVVIGYATQQRKNLIGSVSKIDPSGTKNIPEASFDAQLQGKAAGVQISSNTGVPGSDIFIRVRGATSINATNDPLYIIDGVWVNNGSLQNIGQDRGTSPLSDINPSDIESIEILKDATAIAIYGSRGANGVVLVTTKRGTYGQKTRIEFNGSEGLGWAPEDRIWKTTTGAEHAALVNEYSRNMGKPQPFRPAGEVINGVAGRGLPETQPTYDRMSYLNRKATLRSYDLSLQGGSDRTRFYLGGGYTDQESIWKPMSFDRASLKVNLDHKLNDKISIGTSNAVSRSHRDQARPANGANGTLLQASLNIPTYLPIFDANGTPLKWVNFDNIDVLTSTVNLWSNSYHYTGNIYLDYAITPKLKFRSTFGVDYNNYEENEYWDTRTILGNSGGRGTQSITQSSTAINEQTLAYNDKAGKHSFGILIGNTLQGIEVKNVSATGTNFPNNSYTQISSAATQVAAQFMTNSTLASFFSRADYNYAGKYYAEFTVRADGSSKFGKNKKWGYFPAVGAAWRIKEENFLKDVSLISNLKYRISYGITGNQAGINDFASQGLWTGGFGYADVASGPELPGTAPLQLANPNLKWESTAQFSTGLDIGFLEDKLNIEFNYYNKYTSDALLQVAVPGSSGFSSYLTNFGEISNKGFELAINSTNLRTTGFTWKTDFNIARNKNTIEKIPADIPFAGRDLIRLQQGKELYSYWLYKQLSVNPDNGDAIFDDYNKDGKITADDRQIVGSTWPKFFGGLTNNFTYKGLDLGVFFTFSYGNYIWNHNRMLGETGGTLDAGRVLLKSQLDRWTSPGQITNTPKLTDANYARQENSRFFEDASFLRLRSLTLGYTLPKGFTSRAGIEKLRFYLIGSNLLLFTKYTGADPESNLGTQNIQGYDYGTPPQPRTVQLGVNLTL
ncbi:SusC/RagA family TonB-linked outer membrane protein [Pedobacter nyackensis]|uniref:TonB-linked outer membrane protein, SusC/RagA family n=1 Tax=Pedobacter nyackensis TaxID=475255 RepID=A0A1W2EFX2_9SPHI|nr:TonB-dependent receptor [Pedobacter nyackensis]SMD08650.1 TonB-linked outer membrane protein, SusC/RagA family [Pedobacter nyackensis]